MDGVNKQISKKYTQKRPKKNHQIIFNHRRDAPYPNRCLAMKNKFAYQADQQKCHQYLSQVSFP